MAAFFDDKLGGCSCARSKCSDECSTYRNFKPKPQTNADRIRQMTDEELAEWMGNRFYPECPCCPVPDEICGGWEPDNCKKYLVSWLKSPVEEVDNGSLH